MRLLTTAWQPPARAICETLTCMATIPRSASPASIDDAACEPRSIIEGGADTPPAGGLSTVGCSVSDGALWLTWVCGVRRAGGGGAPGLCRAPGNVGWSCHGGCMSWLGGGLGVVG